MIEFRGIRYLKVFGACSIRDDGTITDVLSAEVIGDKLIVVGQRVVGGDPAGVVTVDNASLNTKLVVNGRAFMLHDLINRVQTEQSQSSAGFRLVDSKIRTIEIFGSDGRQPEHYKHAVIVNPIWLDSVSLNVRCDRATLRLLPMHIDVLELNLTSAEVECTGVAVGGLRLSACAAQISGPLTIEMSGYACAINGCNIALTTKTAATELTGWSMDSVFLLNQSVISGRLANHRLSDAETPRQIKKRLHAMDVIDWTELTKDDDDE